ncbi:potassium channel family protein [Neolewinella agarilytica]|uniref:potassium channel family protein n=1 Tax=Neolewinella agarilytica TaxID=478744 RepID=UPI001FE13A0B|nr:potassium channel protein [Neolewinella agarilytica]
MSANSRSYFQSSHIRSPVYRILSLIGVRSSILSLRVAVYLVVGIIIIGAAGLMLLEDYSLVNALYMSIITISTVGFGEVEPLSSAGKLFVSAMMLLNIGIVAYSLATFSYYVIDGKIFEQMEQQRMRSKVNALSDHTILCGFGRYGKEIARHLLEHGQQFVVIDEKKEKLQMDQFAEADIAYIVGDATHDEVLKEAGIEKAGSLITALNDDSDNLFIVITAKDLNPKMQIISRAHQARSRAKLRRAGASQVIMPEQIGGFYMATLVSKPGAVEFFSYVTNEMDSDIGFEEIKFSQLPEEMRGKSIREMSLRKESGVNVIGHRLAHGRYIVNPDPEAVLQPGDSFITVGSQPQIRALRTFLKR